MALRKAMIDLETFIEFVPIQKTFKKYFSGFKYKIKFKSLNHKDSTS